MLRHSTYTITYHDILEKHENNDNNNNNDNETQA